MKIAIETKGFDQKGGLIDFIRHITFCIDIANKDCSKEISILIPKNNLIFNLKKWIYSFKELISSFVKYRKLNWIKYSGFNPNYLDRVFNDLKNIKKVFPGYTYKSHLSYIQKNKFDIVFPLINLPSNNFKIPWIGYFWDFQHKYYPEFFDKNEINKRDIFTKYMFNEAKHVVVNSHAVKQDAIKFIKNYKSKIHVIPFCPGAKLEWIQDKRDITNKYNIKKPYFIICNQFYIHKNHETAFKAFAKLLNTKGDNYELVCTGTQNDNRNIQYIYKLQELLRKLKIEKNVIFTGYIPKIDQISLLKKSLALLQPTLFEGGPGGGSSYDAISLGHRLILSDIPINREVEINSNISFFNPLSDDDLKNLLLKIINSKFQRTDDKTLLELSKRRMEICGKKLILLAEEIINENKKIINLKV